VFPRFVPPAGYFLSGYIGLSLPAIAVGIVLQSVTPRGTLLTFAIAVSTGTLAASPLLLARRRHPDRPSPRSPQHHLAGSTAGSPETDNRQASTRSRHHLSG